MFKLQSMITKLARVAYVLGSVLLIVGFILTATIQPVKAYPIDDSIGYTDYDGSYLVFISGCTGDCTSITAVVQNQGDPMEDVVNYEVWYHEWGDPIEIGSRIFVGIVPALGTNETFVLTYDPTLNSRGPEGNYRFRTFQRPDFPNIVYDLY